LDNIDHLENVVDSLLHQKHHHIVDIHHNGLYYLYNGQMHIEIFQKDMVEKLK
jgi:hypothetical protein